MKEEDSDDYYFFAFDGFEAEGLEITGIDVEVCEAAGLKVEGLRIGGFLLGADEESIFVGLDGAVCLDPFLMLLAEILFLKNLQLKVMF